MGTQSAEAAPRYRDITQVPQRSIDIVVVSDTFSSDTLGTGEIARHLHRYDRNKLINGNPHSTTVPNFNTLATSVVVGQYGLQNDHDGLVVFATTAPYGIKPEHYRKPNAPARKREVDHAFVITQLANGTTVFLPNIGFNGSLIRDRAVNKFWELDIDPGKTKDRARDVYARAVMDYLNGDAKIIDESVSSDSIPPFPGGRVGYVDGYGNVQATDRQWDWSHELEDEDEVTVTIGDALRVVKNRVTREGPLEEGDLVIQVGSLGGRSNPFLEVARVRNFPQSARREFRVPVLYSENIIFQLTPVEDAVKAERDRGDRPKIVHLSSALQEENGKKEKSGYDDNDHP